MRRCTTFRPPAHKHPLGRRLTKIYSQIVRSTTKPAKCGFVLARAVMDSSSFASLAKPSIHQPAAKQFVSLPDTIAGDFADSTFVEVSVYILFTYVKHPSPLTIVDIRNCIGPPSGWRFEDASGWFYCRRPAAHLMPVQLCFAQEKIGPSLKTRYTTLDLGLIFLDTTLRAELPKAKSLADEAKRSIVYCIGSSISRAAPDRLFSRDASKQRGL